MEIQKIELTVHLHIKTKSQPKRTKNSKKETKQQSKQQNKKWGQLFLSYEMKWNKIKNQKAKWQQRMIS